MSWRETLGLAAAKPISSTQNTHNAQKSPARGNSAYCAYIAYQDSEETSKQLEALADACSGLDITPADVKKALAPEDIEDWRNGAINTGTLAAFARALVQRREMDQGKRPDHYTEHATCRHCGPVWLWFPGEVSGCPWCWNRLAEKPIPRPSQVRCRDCLHFSRTNHPNLGHCARGEVEAPAGLWDTDQRTCDRYLPNPSQTGSDQSKPKRTRTGS